jgi:hypothetical protein
MLIQEVLTDLSPEEIVQRAKEFFSMRLTAYTGFLEEESDHHVKFEMDAGELMVAASAGEGGRTRVRGSTSRAHHELSQFLSTLAPAEEVRQNLPGPGASGAG